LLTSTSSSFYQECFHAQKEISTVLAKAAKRFLISTILRRPFLFCRHAHTAELAAFCRKGCREVGSAADQFWSICWEEHWEPSEPSAERISLEGGCGQHQEFITKGRNEKEGC
jgi:hypothetical protein